MARLNQKQHLLMQVLAVRAEQIDHSGLETQLWLDHENGHYQILRVGWENEYQRVYGPLLHIDIKNDKFWIQVDNTEDGIVNDLIANGIDKSEIVLAFYPAYRRPHTEFAVA